MAAIECDGLTKRFGSLTALDGLTLEVPPGQVFGFLLLVCIPVGLALAGLVALWFDRRSSKHTREVTVDHESVQVDDDRAS